MRYWDEEEIIWDRAALKPSLAEVMAYGRRKAIKEMELRRQMRRASRDQKEQAVRILREVS